MSLAAIRPDLRIAWHGPTMLLVDVRGEAGPLAYGGGGAKTGLWLRETRYLRTLRLRIDGTSPHLCSLGGVGARRIDAVYVYPELRAFSGGGSGQARSVETFAEGGVRHRAIDVRVRHVVELDGLATRVSLANRSRHRARLRVEVELGADYADLSEVIGDDEPSPRAGVRARSLGAGLELRSEHPALPYRTVIDAPGARVWRRGVVWELDLPPRGEATLSMRVHAIDFEDALGRGARADREDALARWRGSHARIEASGSGAAPLVVRAALEDFASLPLLEGRPDEWLAPQAGLPIYPALFGRDALTAAWHASIVDCGAMLEASLTRLARLQARREDPRVDAEPGRIPQQVRRGPRARLGDEGLGITYADVAGPLMFVVALAQLVGVRGASPAARAHLDAARRVLAWADALAARSEGGFLAYHTRSPHAPEHQGWKDSGGAMVHADGRDARTPIAACEIQGYWFAALELFALVLWLVGERDEARARWAAARALRERFHRAFWMEDEGFYALGIDRDGRLLRSVTSNVGHCLAAGIVAPSVLRRVVERMFEPDLWSGWGFRTLSSAHPAYEPLSYHRGSVWAVESATIALGLRRFGFDARAMQVVDATLELASRYEGMRVPECVGGYARGELPHPGAYPRADLVQAWNVSAIPALLHASLGLFNVAPLDLLALDPILPSALDALRVRGLRVGRGSVDLDVWRDRDGRSRFEVVGREGTLHVVRQPPPESISAGPGERLRALVEGMVAA